MLPELLLTFFRIGLVAFGGGWSVVGIIRNEVVPRWMTPADFSSLIAIAQATPGPVALNAATLVGWRMGGLGYAAAATLAVITLPVLILVAYLLLARRFRGGGNAIDEALRTTSLAMILMTLWTLRPTEFHPLLAGFAVAAFVLGSFTKVNAVWVILGAGALNALAGFLL